MAAASRIASQPRFTMQNAVDHFQESVTPNEAENFQSTTLEDVQAAALKLDRTLAEAGDRRNLRRLEVFFKGLKKFTEAGHSLYDGTPFLPWSWVRKEIRALAGRSVFLNSNLGAGEGDPAGKS